MPDGYFDEAAPHHPYPRKNSILVKDENSASKVNLNAAHPHFVEQILPHRSPSGSDPVPPVPSTGANSAMSSNTSIAGMNAAQERLNSFHMGAAPSGAAIAQAQGDAQTSQAYPTGTAAANNTWNRPYPPPFPGMTASASSSTGSDNHRPTSPPMHAHGPGSEDGSGVAATSSGSQAPFSGRATSKQPSDPRIPMDDGKIHILIGVTGSLHVSSVKSIVLKLQSIYGDRVAIQIIVTPAAEKIVASSSKEHSSHAQQQQQQQQQQPVGNGVPTSSSGSSNTATPGPLTAPGTTATPASSASSYHDATASPLHNSPTPQTTPQPQSQPQSQPQPHAATTLKEKMLNHNIRVWHDSDEWDTWHGRNDPIIHIELRRWADILLIAPLSANTLGKIAMGLCDNLLTNVVRAWNAQYPILIAPAMVTYAYNHPATKRQLQLIREEMKWIEILRPTEKVVGSTGGIGMGGMMPWNEIVDRVVQKLGGYPDEDEEDDEDEDENENATTMNERREQANRSSANGDDDDDDDDDEEDDDDDDDNILKDVDHSHIDLSPNGSPI